MKSFSQNYVLVAAQLELSDNFSLSDRWDRLEISTSLFGLSAAELRTSDSATAHKKTDPKKEVTQWVRPIPTSFGNFCLIHFASVRVSTMTAI